VNAFHHRFAPACQLETYPPPPELRFGGEVPGLNKIAASLRRGGVDRLDELKSFIAKPASKTTKSDQG
jgi:hypothetical protein